MFSRGVLVSPVMSGERTGCAMEVQESLSSCLSKVAQQVGCYQHC